MTAKHRDPEFIRNAKIIRRQVHRAWRVGDDVNCWRCRRSMEPGTPFDVGHLDADGGPAVSNLAAECRRCNRSAGGKIGAAITNQRRTSRPTTTATRTSRVGLAPW